MINKKKIVFSYLFATVVSLIFVTAMGTGTQTFNNIYAQNATQSNNTSMSLESLTGIPYPDIPHENPDAVAHNSKFIPPKVVKVTDGVYSAIGYGMANIMMVEGIDGIIIVDAGETNEQAEQALAEFRQITPKPVVAVIYTHNHVDHTEGAGVFVKDGESAGKKVAVIGQETLVNNYYKSYGALGPQQASFSYRWGEHFYQNKERIG